MRAARRAYVDAMAPGQRDALQAAMVAMVMAHLGAGGIVGSYCAIGAEIDPAALPCPFLFPRVADDDGLRFHRCARGDLVAGFGGIPSPDAGLPDIEPDILLLPLVAVDGHGNRLGQGAGHYDRTLARLRRIRLRDGRPPLVTIGLAWDVQLIDAVPADPWDQPLDAIATPTRWISRH